MEDKDLRKCDGNDEFDDFASKRRSEAYEIRKNAAKFYKKIPLLDNSCSNDEKIDPNYNFSKGLPHNQLGEVDPHSYNVYLKALMSGSPIDLEKIPLGGGRKLVNPLAAYAFELVGLDCHQGVIEPPPSFDSAVLAAEMVELYWQALTRDIPFTEYRTNPLTIDATNELSSLSEFRGPRINGLVTPDTLFRENLPGAMEGPYISQFLWKDIPFIGTKIVQRYPSPAPEIDYLTSYQNWLDVQNGLLVPSANGMDLTLQYIRNARDLSKYVHRDISFESGLTACLILLSYGNQALDKDNPYLKSNTQVGFATFGPPHILDFMSRAVRPALEAAWFHKWLVYRRLRPEEFGGRIHNKMNRTANYPIHPDVLHSKAVSQVFNKYGTYLLPQAYPEGCPTHPSYPAGHATFVGAMVTILKAFFNESFVIPDPVKASSDGRSLESYIGSPLTVGGELNKLAYNIAIGRNAAGVHYRSECISGLKAGEEIAISILRDYKTTYYEDFKGFSIHKFDGTKIRV